VAELKLSVPERCRPPCTVFHGFTAVAELKRFSLSVTAAAGSGVFHGFTAVAELKS